MNREALESLDKETLVQTISALTRQIDFLTTRVSELEAKLGLPPKTPDNSSTPPEPGAKGLGLGGGKARAQGACRGAPASAS